MSQEKPARGIHHLKSDPIYFAAVLQKRLPFQIRNDDRKFDEGDEVVLHEWSRDRASSREADGYTGRTVRGTVTFVHHPENLPKGVVAAGYVVLGISWNM